MKKLLLLIVLLLLPSQGWAQTDVVASVKANLLARGVNLSGECGGFAITQRVAWQLRGTGAGLLSKPSGSNCQGFSTDIIAYADGRIVDILSDSGGSNGPQWNPGEPVDASRWRAAFDPGDSPNPAPTPQPTPAPVLTIDYTRVQSIVAQEVQKIYDQNERINADKDNQHAATMTAIAGVSAQVKQHDEQPSWITKVLTDSKTYLTIAGVLGGYFAKAKMGNSATPAATAPK